MSRFHSKTSTLLKNVRVLDPSQNLDQVSDVLIENGTISAIEKAGAIPVTKAQDVRDLKGHWVMPGLFDIHVHLREPGLEYKETIETGTMAAVAGGFTSVACMANTMPVNDNPYVTAFIRERAKQFAFCRVFPIGAVTKGLKGEELAEIGSMVSEGAVALSDDGMTVMNSYVMRKAMDYAKAFSVPVITHSEDVELVGRGVMNEGALSNELGLRGNPAAAEEIMVARDIALARLTRCPIHIAHVSSHLSLEHIKRAKEDGVPVTAEASPHHLSLDETHMRSYDSNYKMAPPLRSQEDVEALRKALESGVIDVIATDHAPHGIVDKDQDFDEAANGIIGLQTAVPVALELIHKNIVKPLRWVDAFSTRAFKILGLSGGSLKKGSTADLTVINPHHDWTFESSEIASKSFNTPYLGHKFKGAVTHTIIGGQFVYSRE